MGLVSVGFAPPKKSSVAGALRYVGEDIGGVLVTISRLIKFSLPQKPTVVSHKRKIVSIDDDPVGLSSLGVKDQLQSTSLRPKNGNSKCLASSTLSYLASHNQPF